MIRGNKEPFYNIILNEIEHEVSVYFYEFVPVLSTNNFCSRRSWGWGVGIKEEGLIYSLFKYIYVLVLPVPV